MTIYNFLRRSNIRFKLYDTKVIGRLAQDKAKEQGVVYTKVLEQPWRKQQNNKPYMVNDYPESFIDELIKIAVPYFNNVLRQQAESKAKTGSKPRFQARTGIRADRMERTERTERTERSGVGRTERTGKRKRIEK